MSSESKDATLYHLNDRPIFGPPVPTIIACSSIRFGTLIFLPRPLLLPDPAVLTCSRRLTTHMGVFDLDPQFTQQLERDTYNPILRPGRDVMAAWPDEWDPADNQRWAAVLPWGAVSGQRNDVRGDTGYDQHVLNHAFHKLFRFIPSRTDGQVLHFDVRTNRQNLTQSDVDAKMRNFYKMFQWIKQYPVERRMSDEIGVSEHTFHAQIMPTIYCAAEHINFMDPQLRFWQYNHCEHFQERVTAMCDGYPVRVSCSQNRFVQRLLKSGK